ncbi:MAG TPA: dUTP diphosphatase [Actinomycetota bacterium]|nr:dUTP diphosphatase [Actinomycetota bacterium]
MKLSLKLLDPDLPPPSYAHAGDAGLDLRAAEDVELKPGGRALVPTGVAIALPPGYAGLVLPRSGRALAEGLGLANSPGLIDSGYRGELKVVLVNLDFDTPIHVRRGDKIAQLVVQEVEHVVVDVSEELSESERGPGGFGSSGR